MWLRGYGNVFEKTLSPGEQFDVEPGGWLYKDLSVQMETNYQGLTAGLLGGMRRVQSVYRTEAAGRTAIETSAVPAVFRVSSRV